MRQAVEQRGRHLGVAEDSGPFSERQVCGDDDRGAFVKPADQVEEQSAAGLGEGQITEFVEDHKVERGQVVGNAALLAAAMFGFQAIDEIDDVEEAAVRRGVELLGQAAARHADTLVVAAPPARPGVGSLTASHCRNPCGRSAHAEPVRQTHSTASAKWRSTASRHFHTPGKRISMGRTDVR